MLLSVAVVAGLAATVSPARAAVSAPYSAAGTAARLADSAPAITPPSGPVTVTLGSPDVDISPGVTQDFINEYQGASPRLSDTIKRMLDEYSLDQPDANTSDPAWVDFDGTLSVTPDGTGMSITIPAAEVQTQTSISWWLSIIIAAASTAVGFGARGLCLTYTGGIDVVCTPVGAFVGTFLNGVIRQAIQKQLASASSWAITLGSAVAAAMGGYAWEKWGKAFFKSDLGPLLNTLGNWIIKISKTTFSFLGSPIVGYLQAAGDLFSGLAAGIPGALDWIAAHPPFASLSCDVYDNSDTPCTAAYSMDRALYSYYDGPLYQVKRASDGTTADVGLLSPGGYVDASQQDSFCAQTSCTITKLYDQSPEWNDLTIEGSGTNGGADQGAVANALPITVDNKEAYGLDITQGTGYRDDGPGSAGATGVATGSEPEGMYMVASGTNVNSQCCFDFGNAETHNDDDGGGAMDALNVSTRCNTHYGATCDGAGPWVQADLENGLFQDTGTSENTSDTPNASDFVTAVLKNDGTSNFELEGGNSQSGTLSTLYSGPLPTQEGSDKWAPMRKEGAVVLGTGGDNSNGGTGSFFEGVMTDGTPTDAADAAVQANIVAAQYAGAGGTQNADAAVVNDGITYDFSVDAKDGDLQVNSLTAQGADWATQDLSAAGTPPVLPGTAPVAVVHDGVTSVFTISAADDHLWETHMRPGVTSWKADDLTVLAKTPPSKVTPSALFHDGYTTVYTVDASNGHLQTTYLEVLNGPWTTADLTAQTPGAPTAQPGTSPASILHDGEVSVFTVGTGHDIWETYLPTIDGTWSARDITALSDGPETTSTVTAVFHQGVLTVFAAGDPLRHLFKLRLPSLGGAWSAQDLTAGAPETPPVAPGTAPAALFHNGYTSVYTVDETSLDLQTTYLSSLSGDWATENLSADYKTPPTTETPVPLLHPGTDGQLDRLSVFTVNQFDNDLQDTYLVAEGDPWTTQDMHALASVPPATVNASPTATWSVAADGVTYVFTEDPSTGDLMVTWLTAQGADWQKMDLTAAEVAPQTGTFQTAAVAWDGHVTVFSVNTKGHLWATTLNAPGGTWTGTDLTATTGGPPTAVPPTAVFHGGQLNAYTVADNGQFTDPGDLEQYYLPAGSTTWSVLDLTTAGGGPQVAAGSSPSALYHDGYTSVYVNAADTHHLQNYFLTAIGNPWAVQDLTDIGGADTLAPETSPAALYHSGYVTVFSVGNHQGDIWETSLPAIGDSWTSLDLSTTTGVPPEPLHIPGSDGPMQVYLAALYHSGYTGVYSIDAAGDLHGTFLPAIGANWQTQNLTTIAPHVPLSTPLIGPSALLHYDANGGLTRTSVFTINEFGAAGAPANGTLQDSDLDKIGDSWATQTLPN